MEISKNTAPHYTWGDDCDGWHLLQGDDLHIIHERMPPGSSERRHYHPTARQFFFVLRGELTMELAGAEVKLLAGAGLHVEPLAPHQAINGSNGDVEFLVVSSPSTRGNRVDLEPRA